MTSDLIAITDLPRELRKRGIIRNYGQCWRAGGEGLFPVVRLGGRLFVQASDLEQIAAAFAPAEE